MSTALYFEIGGETAIRRVRIPVSMIVTELMRNHDQMKLLLEQLARRAKNEDGASDSFAESLEAAAKHLA